MQRGGARPGAGRKPKGIKRVIHASPIQAVEAKISAKLPWLADKLFELAEGVQVQKTDRRGRTRIYTEPPDRQAIEYLMDRVMGKPTQPFSLVDRVREMARAAGVDEDAAVAEVESILRETRGARST